jgi:hypothetical protein
MRSHHEGERLAPRLRDPHRFARPQHFMTLEPSMICTLVLENGRRDSLLYLRVSTVFKLLRLVEQAVAAGLWTHVEISKI